MLGGLVTAAQVEAMESLLRTTQAAQPLNGGTMVPDTIDYAKMSPIQRLHYAHEQAAKKAERR
jgi:hypothetical protein